MIRPAINRWTDSDLGIAARVLGMARGRRLQVLGVALLAIIASGAEGIGLYSVIPLIAASTGKGAAAPEQLAIVRWLSGDNPTVSARLMITVLLLIFGVAVGYLNFVLSKRLAMRFADDLRRSLFEGILQRPLDELISLPPGNLLNAMASDSWRVCEALFLVISVVIELIACGVLLSLLWLISPLYTGVLVASLILMGAMVWMVTHATAATGSSAVAANQRQSGYLWEALAGLRIIRGFGREQFERERFQARSETVRRTFLRLELITGSVVPIMQFISICMIGTLIWITVDRGMAIEPLLGFVAIAYRLQPRISSIISAGPRLRGMQASLIEVESGSAPTPVHHGVRDRPIPAIREGINLEGVTVHYQGASDAALRGVSCSFAAGSVTAVVGLSGAGKSTLISILLGFASPSSGRVVVDGTDLKDLDPGRWQRIIAFADHNPFLFTASVRDNIAYGKPGASSEQIVAAARMARADGFISALPQGYDTIIGEGGVRLSDGQRQRVALARAFVRQPELLIIDEGMSALDLPTELEIRTAMEQQGGTGIVIIVAHRRQTVVNADRIIVIEDGRIVETGSPAQLVGAGGAFARIFASAAADSRKRGKGP